MSQKTPPKKKVVVTTKKKQKASSSGASSRSKKATATKSKVRSKTSAPAEPLTFGRDNYLWMGIGAGLVLLGMILMSGGSMPSPEVWDENLIYSTRRTVLAPIVIMLGLVVEIYAIFRGYRIEK